MRRDIIDNGGARLAACPGNHNPTSDLACAASQCIGIELEQMTQCFGVSGSQLFEHPAIQRCIDPTGARSAWIMREPAGCHNRDSFGSIFKRVSDRSTELVTLARR